MEHVSEAIPNTSRSNNDSSAINDILPSFPAFVHHISDDDSNDESLYLSDEDHTSPILEECNADVAGIFEEKSTDEDFTITKIMESEFQQMYATNAYCKTWPKETGLQILQPGNVRLVYRQSVKRGCSIFSSKLT